MMKGLYKDNFILAEANNIVFGTFENEEKWALYDADSNLMMYYIDNDFEVIDFDETLKPSDYNPYKYLYINGTFTLNPDYVEPLPPIEDRVTEVEGDIVTLTESLMNTDLTAVDLYEQLLAQTDINTAQDATLIELYELIYT